MGQDNRYDAFFTLFFYNMGRLLQYTAGIILAAINSGACSKSRDSMNRCKTSGVTFHHLIAFVAPQH